jgi:hypothetical protein
LDGVVQLLNAGGALPVYQAPSEAPQVSAKRKGVRQGGILLLSGALVVPILGVLSSFAPSSEFLTILVAIAAIICFIGGPLRMIYAALFEEGAPNRYQGMPAQIPPIHMPQAIPVRPVPALPSPAVNAAPSWRSRPDTGEIVRPPSVTENTTRLLDKDDPNRRQ